MDRRLQRGRECGHVTVCVCVCVCRMFDYERVNRLLRQELDDATSANDRLATELSAVRQQLNDRETEWSREAQVCTLTTATTHRRTRATHIML